ncbi:phosphoribosylanthranilate isomerase [Clostridium sp. D33t1_170424_F3]|uniref:phosphoribosylanthranilate isomerase n=1 Tax=Clostridium sp. D33t1_170424_F3 TaxID=2787099 RepID=UPI0018AB93D2|nr:phosphoribosylanthranilate isomerase [Clostridium sp. D33t1_170424_F3]
MKVKLCGIRRPEDISYVNAFPPNYIGFVFAKSKRQVTAETTAALTQQLRQDIQTVGVFVNEPLESLLHIAQTARLNVLQLHGDEDDAYIAVLRQRTGLPVWKAIRVTDAESLQRADRLPVDRLLLDSFSPAAYGGTGQTANWAIIRTARPQKPFFLAGGLTIDNLEEAIESVRPDGVDLSGGIETGGCKDREKIKAVVERVRQIDYQYRKGLNQ